MDKFERFRSEAPVFEYRSFTVSETPDSVEIDYVFSINGVAEFRPGWSFPRPEGISVKSDAVFERLAFSLGMAEAVSYWKAACSPVMKVKCGERDGTCPPNLSAYFDNRSDRMVTLP